MFEHHQYQRRYHNDRGKAPSFSYEPVTDITAMSMLYWGEHCIECAAPDCYRSCALFQARPDGLCRRFEYGIYKDRRYRSFRGYGADVAFKRWGRLKANGNTVMEPAHRLIWKERLIAAGVPLLRSLCRLFEKLTGNPHWRARQPRIDHWVRQLHRRKQSLGAPSAFLVEAINSGAEPVRLQLVMRVGEDLYDQTDADNTVPAPLVESLTLESGYSRHVIDRQRFSSITECGIPFKLTVTPDGDDGARVVFLTLDFVETAQPIVATAATPIKCVVFDLDDTVWSGTLLEGGSLALKATIADAISELDRRGILLSIASKNDPVMARRQLDAFGLSEMFLHPRINWLPKSVNLEAIAQALNIALESFAFVDDNPFERDEVSRRLPAVLCMAPEQLTAHMSDRRFHGSLTGDARNRRTFYRNQEIRDKHRAQFGSDHLAFLADCQIELAIDPLSPADVPRAADLAQRTNQLNFSGRRYDEKAIGRLLMQEEQKVFILRSQDKYGSYGTVGLGIARAVNNDIHLDEFMLSCRVQGRHIEKAFFDYLVRTWPMPAHRLIISFKPTARNHPARAVIEGMGFLPVDGGSGYVIALESADFTCPVIHLATSRVAA